MKIICPKCNKKCSLFFRSLYTKTCECNFIAIAEFTNEHCLFFNIKLITNFSFDYDFSIWFYEEKYHKIRFNNNKFINFYKEFNDNCANFTIKQTLNYVYKYYKLSSFI